MTAIVERMADAIKLSLLSDLTRLGAMHLPEAKAALSALQPELQQVREGLACVVNICQSDLETHFGKKYGGKIRKALATLDTLIEPKP